MSFEEREFRQFVDKNHLSATLYRAIQRDQPEWFPAGSRDYCKLHYLQQWRTNEVLLRNSATIAQRLRAEGIDHCFLKGVFLAARYFEDQDSRYSSDIDLMIRAADLRTAERVLQSCGFQRRSKTLISDRLTVRYTNNLEYSGKDCDLDLHWSIGEHLSYRCDPDQMLRDRISWTIGPRTFDVPSDEHMLLTHILGAFGDIELGTNTLKPLWDMDRILATMDESTDWDGFFERRREEGLLAIAVNILAMTLCLWNSANRLPCVSAALTRRSRWIRFEGEPQCVELAMCAQRFAARRWAWSLYDTHAVKSLYWWTVSLPFRIAASRPSRRASIAGDTVAPSRAWR